MSERSRWAEVRQRLAEEWAKPIGPDPETVMRARARRIAQPPDAAAFLEDDVLRARVGGAVLELPMASVVEVTLLPRWVPLPGTPRHLLGLARVGSALAPVFDIGPLVTGRATERGADARLITLSGAGPALSFVAEAVLDTVASPTDRAAAPDDAPAFVAGITSSGELFVDPDALLADPRLMVDQRDAT